jgi:hypothetical protein
LLAIAEHLNPGFSLIGRIRAPPMSNRSAAFAFRQANPGRTSSCPRAGSPRAAGQQW